MLHFSMRVSAYLSTKNCAFRRLPESRRQIIRWLFFLVSTALAFIGEISIFRNAQEDRGIILAANHRKAIFEVFFQSYLVTWPCLSLVLLCLDIALVLFWPRLVPPPLPWLYLGLGLTLPLSWASTRFALVLSWRFIGASSWSTWSCICLSLVLAYGVTLA